ncbi:MAG: OmpA family protein [Ignavibacteriae bacterium]|nr:OmpA family protein [Ignavibacteriota bacterium]
MKTKSFICLILLCFIVFSNNLIAQNQNKLTSKFDFIPGENVIFYDDFTSENIGDFPLQWNTNGSGEIVTSEKFEGRWFQITKTGYYVPEAKESFTDNFTIEFDFVPLNSVQETATGIHFFFLSGDLSNPGYGSQPGNAGLRISPDYDLIGWNNWSEAREWQGDNGSVSFMFNSSDKYHISFWIQKQRVRMYVNEEKVLDIPRGLQEKYVYNIFRIETYSDETTPLISNFRIAAGQQDMRSKLITDGKLITYGILFDVNSDKIKPISIPTIKEIANILKDNSTLKVKIIGHTDSDGDENSNLELSKRRSESVKNELLNLFGIDAARIETEGKGESLPIAQNDTSINKAKNRRVEFIKL